MVEVEHNGVLLAAVYAGMCPQVVDQILHHLVRKFLAPLLDIRIMYVLMFQIPPVLNLLPAFLTLCLQTISTRPVGTEARVFLWFPTNWACFHVKMVPGSSRLLIKSLNPSVDLLRTAE